jgi:hypothetical protein
MWCPKGCKTQGAAAFLPLIAPSATSTTTSCPLAARRERASESREKYRVVAGAAEHIYTLAATWMNYIVVINGYLVVVAAALALKL